MRLSPAFQVHNLLWSDISNVIKPIIPPLTRLDHKGVMGRIGVIGGSKDYCGAPYYASTASLHFGGDLSYVFCSKQAAGPIKSYSPEAMVTPFYDDELFSTDKDVTDISKSSTALVSEFFPRMHTLVIGPGLGRNSNVLQVVETLVQHAKSKNVSLVIDADGLWMVANNLSLIIGYSRCILTPNRVEFDRLVQSAADQFPTSPFLKELSSDSDIRKMRALSALLRVTIIKKGSSDMISSGSVESTPLLFNALVGDDSDLVYTRQDVFVMQSPEGSPRRCGGQGDVLAGSLGTALHWAIKRHSEEVDIPCVDQLKNLSNSSESFTEIDHLPKEDAVTDSSGVCTAPSNPPGSASLSDAMVYACILASSVTRRASEMAFTKKGRAMTSPDVLNSLGIAFADITQESYD